MTPLRITYIFFNGIMRYLLQAKLTQYCQATIQPLFHLIIPNFQGLHGGHKKRVGKRHVIIRRVGKVHGPEETQQPPHFWKVFHKGPQ